MTTHMISLFICGVIFMLSGFVYKLFGVLFQESYFEQDNCSISLIKESNCTCMMSSDDASKDVYLNYLNKLYLPSEGAWSTTYDT